MKLGYEDEYYFSRFFKVNADVSPQLYRDTVGYARGVADYPDMINGLRSLLILPVYKSCFYFIQVDPQDANLSPKMLLYV